VRSHYPQAGTWDACNNVEGIIIPLPVPVPTRSSFTARKWLKAARSHSRWLHRATAYSRRHSRLCS